MTYLYGQRQLAGFNGEAHFDAAAIGRKERAEGKPRDKRASNLHMIALRTLALFAIGSCLGAIVNLGIYRLAYFRRRISPWSSHSRTAPPAPLDGSDSNRWVAEFEARSEFSWDRILDPPDGD